MAIAGGPEAGLLGSAWVVVLRALSQLDLLQAVLTRRALDKKAAEVREVPPPCLSGFYTGNDTEPAAYTDLCNWWQSMRWLRKLMPGRPLILQA